MEGINQEKVTAEGSIKRIDDLQFLLTDPTLLTLTAADEYYSAPIPTDYLGWCRVTVYGKDDCCPERKFMNFISKEVDVDINIQDVGKQPSFEWATTFSILANNQVKVYTGNKFTITQALLTYYRKPVFIEIAGVVNIYTGVTPTVSVLCEAPDNVVEVIIEESCGILARDIKSYQEAQMNYQSADKNT